MTHSKDIAVVERLRVLADRMKLGVSYYLEGDTPGAAEFAILDADMREIGNLAALRPAADPKAEGVAVANAARKAVSEWTKVDLSLFAGGRIASAVIEALAPPTPDAERAGEHLSVEDQRLLSKALRNSVEIIAPQSPATEAVSEAILKRVRGAADILDMEFHDEEEPHIHNAVKVLREVAALIRPPVNNSPEHEHIVADVSKASADTEGGTR